MDFEKIVELLPIGVTIWRTETDFRADEDLTDFRLVYANSKASLEAGHDLFDSVGRKLDSLPPITITKYPVAPDVWMRVLIRHESERIEKTIGDRTFEINVAPLDTKCVVCVFRDITSEKNVAEKTSISLQNIIKADNEFKEYRQKKSGKFKLK